MAAVPALQPKAPPHQGSQSEISLLQTCCTNNRLIALEAHQQTAFTYTRFVYEMALCTRLARCRVQSRC